MKKSVKNAETICKHEKKPYNIVLNDDNTAEINMYGDVVSKHPVDWWTGEKVPGNFIALDDFLEDLNDLQEKDTITVHIHSGGGEMYAGIAIYNRLRNMKPKIITVNDGLAASAASLIFMAGDKRKVHSGSNLMIHDASVWLCDAYQIPGLEAVIKELKSHNQAGVNIYAEVTGRKPEEIQQLMDDETWMTGQEAVDEGFATEVITDDGSEPIEFKLSPDRKSMMVGGRIVAACLHGSSLPKNAVQVSEEDWKQISAAVLPENRKSPAEQQEKNTPNGGIEMEIKNIEDLRAAYPEFCQDIENAGRTAGAADERTRIQGIESIEAAVGDAEMVRDAKYGNPINAQELAFAAMQKNAKIGAVVAAGLAQDAAESGAADVTASPAAETEEKSADELATDSLLSAVNFITNKEDK